MRRVREISNNRKTEDDLPLNNSPAIAHSDDELEAPEAHKGYDTLKECMMQDNLPCHCGASRISTAELILRQPNHSRSLNLATECSLRL